MAAKVIAVPENVLEADRAEYRRTRGAKKTAASAKKAPSNAAALLAKAKAAMKSGPAKKK